MVQWKICSQKVGAINNKLGAKGKRKKIKSGFVCLWGVGLVWFIFCEMTRYMAGWKGCRAISPCSPLQPHFSPPAALLTAWPRAAAIPPHVLCWCPLVLLAWGPTPTCPWPHPRAITVPSAPPAAPCPVRADGSSHLLASPLSPAPCPLR